MKDQLRYKYKIKRKYFQHSAREVADAAIVDAVIREFDGKRSFLIYYSYGSEADTHALIARLISEDKEVYLPRVEGENVVPVRFYGDDEELVKSALGISEPAGQAYEGQIDVCITPLLAVNSRGYRLGYGGGYYDRYFTKNVDILRAGIGYSLQYTDEFKEDKNDMPLDLFVSERGIITFGR